MGQDKALLPFEGGFLVDRVARQVAEAAGSVTLVGHPERYLHLPYRGIPDIYPSGGPLAGIHAALSSTGAEWNLIVGCDMPGLNAKLLSALLDEAESVDADCLAARSPSGLPEPLCAVYRRCCSASAAAWLESGRRKTKDWLSTLRVAWHPVPSEDPLWNVNSPQDRDAYPKGFHA
jgi:molybdopterin-guanine dinucleotide biosynthesis protein A